MSNTHTIKSRFVASLIANILRGLISFATAILLARWLGPTDFGRMSFLLAAFTAFRQLLDMGTATAFFTFIAQKQRSRRFVRVFWEWMAIQLLIGILLVGLILPDNWISKICQGEQRWIVLIAMVAAFMQGSAWLAASQMAEANRQTIRVQRLNTIVIIIHLGVVAALWFLGKLGILAIFIAMAIEWGIASWVTSKMYWKNTSVIPDTQEPETRKKIFQEFLKFCLPFVPYVWLSFAHDFVDRWMLQNWGGAREQAFYSVAYQFAAVSLLATTSILRIFWKEIAEAYHRKDVDKVKSLYLKTSRGLFFVGALMAGYLLPWTSEIITLTLGKAYLGGVSTMTLMFMYPVHQSTGQICSTMFYATGKSRVQVIQGVVFMCCSIVVAYFMLAPVDAWIGGFGLKSIGLAYKMVIMQFLFVNVQSWMLAKIFHWKFDWKYQAASLVLVLVCGWSTRHLILFIPVLPVLVKMCIGGGVYLCTVAAVLYRQPWIIGLNIQEMQIAISRLSFRKPSKYT